MARETEENRLEFWRVHVENWKKGFFSQKIYCEHNGLSRSSFTRYRKLLKWEAERTERHLRWRHTGRPRLHRPSDEHSANPRPTTPPQPPMGVPQVNRRRHFPDELKRQIVQETLRPGATVSSVARLYGVTPPCIFRWRKLMGLGARRETVAFATVQIGDENGARPTGATPLSSSSSMESTRPKAGHRIGLSGDPRVRFDEGAGPDSGWELLCALEDDRP